MTSQIAVEQPLTATVNSRFSESLLRLHRSLEQVRNDEARVDTMFQAWQKRWLARRDQIASRLEMIESQLSRIVPAGQRTPSTPQLAVFGAPRD